VNRLDAHTGDGIRHRAFTCLVYDTEGRILLAQRAPTKRLWDAHWDGTVASHPVEGQSQKDATEQRLEEELGITPEQYDDDLGGDGQVRVQALLPQTRASSGRSARC